MSLTDLIQTLKAGQLTKAKNEMIRSGKLINRVDDAAGRDNYLAGMHHTYSIEYYAEKFTIMMHNGNVLKIIHVGVASYDNHHYNKPI